MRAGQLETMRFEMIHLFHKAPSSLMRRDCHTAVGETLSKKTLIFHFADFEIEAHIIWQVETGGCRRKTLSG